MELDVAASKGSLNRKKDLTILFYITIFLLSSSTKNGAGLDFSMCIQAMKCGQRWQWGLVSKKNHEQVVLASGRNSTTIDRL